MHLLLFLETCALGKCTMGWFYGFKLHLVINEKHQNFMVKFLFVLTLSSLSFLYKIDFFILPVCNITISCKFATNKYSGPMKKTYFSIITLSLTMLLSISCSKDEDPAHLPETPIEPEVVLTDYSEEVNQYVKRKWIFAIQYKLKDTIGFTIPDTIMMMLDGKTISFADGSTASISSDRKFSVKGENARTNVIDMLDQMEQFFIGEYANQRFSINGMFPLPQDHPDTIYFSTLRNNRLWIGLFDYNTGNQFDE